MRGSLQAYKQVSVNSQLASASPHRVVLMLLSGAIERLVQAKAAMEQGNTSVKGERVSKALAIIGTLRDSLSMEDGGDIATNLDSLYDFMMRHVIEGNSNNQPEKFTEVVDLLREIKSAWEQIPAEFHHLAEES
ncbi:flagellar export chaperone FliS [Photobacterium sp. DNB23_23_1]|uniref:Flagellar secretion chaperone FliS n=1 Tax=Photobacterium pectinilyticum TaxID=2906793 RepID=A0ABT1N0M7_9GAMM|nr:flagellar export chaperone FliS [Photobacterium sp. ZSDE20]MCQ1058298.1 flagellar export chaperone FliS [Photobacterium sp. ZSDE20]MDD1823093.1 flagellar export chaperone FliS [Photobacterium sp. ZSDE20]